MKGKEYFEKYFGDVPKESLDTELPKLVVLLINEMSNEVIALCDARHSRSNSTVDGALKEMNQRYNVVVDMCEKKYGCPVLARSGFLKYWQGQFNKEGHT